jgi:hypothetical protein
MRFNKCCHARVILQIEYVVIPGFSGEKEPPNRGGGEQQETAEGD